MTTDNEQYVPTVAPRTPRSDGLAVTGMILGILAILFGWIYLIIPTVGIVLSAVGLHRVNNSNGWKTGRGMAISGLATSIVGFSLYGLIFLVALGTS